MARRQFVLSVEDQNGLIRAEGQTEDTRELKRLQAVRLYGSGYGVEDIAAITGCSWRALMDWCAAYRASGPAGLKSKWQGENALKLSRAHRADLKHRLDQYRPDQVITADLLISQGQFWTVSDLQIVVKQWYGVTYQCRDSYVSLLHECQFSQQQTERVYRSQPDARVIADFEAALEKK